MATFGSERAGVSLMPAGTAGVWLVLAVVLFVAFLLLKSRLTISGTSADRRAARLDMAAAKQRAHAAGDNASERAKAYRDAAAIALERLGRPGLSASFALRAERADPTDQEALAVLAEALRRASRFRALEKLLWRRLAADEGAAQQRALVELASLYEGPLRRPQRAQALRRLWAMADHGDAAPTAAAATPPTESGA